MKLYYFKDEKGNFGDDLNPWLWEHYFPDFFDNDSSEVFVGVGTLLNYRVPTANKVVVFGSGAGYGDKPNIDDSWSFYCVRGPLTAQVLGIDKKFAISDPAILASQLLPDSIEKKFKFSYMPHCLSATLGDWKEVCVRAGIHYIDPRDDFKLVFNQIKQTEVLLTEAMHGAILADCFRVPWIPIKSSDHISDFKWADWAASIDQNVVFNNIKTVWVGDSVLTPKERFKAEIKRSLNSLGIWSNNWDRPYPRRSSERHFEEVANNLRNISEQGKVILSSDQTFDDNINKLKHCIDKMKHDYELS